MDHQLAPQPDPRRRAGAPAGAAGLELHLPGHGAAAHRVAGPPAAPAARPQRHQHRRREPQRQAGARGQVGHRRRHQRRGQRGQPRRQPAIDDRRDVAARVDPPAADVDVAAAAIAVGLVPRQLLGGVAEAARHPQPGRAHGPGPRPGHRPAAILHAHRGVAPDRAGEHQPAAVAPPHHHRRQPGRASVVGRHHRGERLARLAVDRHQQIVLAVAPPRQLGRGAPRGAARRGQRAIEAQRGGRAPDGPGDRPRVGDREVLDGDRGRRRRRRPRRWRRLGRGDRRRRGGVAGRGAGRGRGRAGHRRGARGQRQRGQRGLHAAATIARRLAAHASKSAIAAASWARRRWSLALSPAGAGGNSPKFTLVGA